MSTLNHHFREHQRAYAAAHRADDRPQHAAHIIGADAAQQLALSHDDPRNYRMQDPFTNQSQHERMDHRFLDGSNDGRGFTYNSSQGRVYVSPQQQQNRLGQQIEYLRTTGELANPTNYDYARSNAEALGMDLRTFNNVSVRQDDLTHYRGVGRPRDSDYTRGGNLRRH
eukprot:gnl/Hemi2/483_TR171_c0_g1_i1.p1 gnl/Hemi2/483_TR171_c0_g1~~gnl/Hemi2/483_TR171_c0_g1_i1.p1  ORF type:complete len:198 (-),score=64.94 gnl/Hemi2/483_TR171_c0_g1_i1:117-623(-)